MEIEVGEWIRSKDGFIGKVQKINYDNMEKSNYYICEKDNVMASNYLENIAKHSKNIIDLIEVKDVIKYRINNISTTLETKGYVEGIVDISDEKILQKIKSDKNYHILEILTKESYMANCYKVGGEDE